MRHMKFLGTSALAVAALLTLVGTAAGTTVTTTTGGAAETPTVHVVSEESGSAGTNHVSFHNSIANIDCNVTLEGKVESHGPGTTAAGAIAGLSVTNCTNGWTVNVLAPGIVEIHWTSGYNGTLTRSGSTVTAIRHTIFGTLECRYSTNNTHLGTITGGNPATVHLEGAIPFHGGSGLCGEGTIQMTGAFATTGSLYVNP